MADAPLHPEVEAAYRRKWREIVGVNPPHEGNSTHRACLLAATLLAAAKAREEQRADADRWRYWRNYWPALCRSDVSRFASIDLKRIHVDSPELMDKVTDAAIRRGTP